MATAPGIRLEARRLHPAVVDAAVNDAVAHHALGGEGARQAVETLREGAAHGGGIEALAEERPPIAAAHEYAWLQVRAAGIAPCVSTATKAHPRGASGRRRARNPARVPARPS